MMMEVARWNITLLEHLCLELYKHSTDQAADKALVVSQGDEYQSQPTRAGAGWQPGWSTPRMTAEPFDTGVNADGTQTH